LHQSSAGVQNNPNWKVVRTLPPSRVGEIYGSSYEEDDSFISFVSHVSLHDPSTKCLISIPGSPFKGFLSRCYPIGLATDDKFLSTSSPPVIIYVTQPEEIFPSTHEPLSALLSCHIKSHNAEDQAVPKGE